MDTKLEKQINQIMTAKERRAARQHRLLRVYGSTVISLTLNLPGGYRRYDRWQQVWHEARRALEVLESVEKHHTSREGLWGPETFMAVGMGPLAVKVITTTIEERHPLGRLFDIDVIDLAGNPVSRKQLGKPARSCLICEKPAIECYLNRAHSLEELMKAVETIIEEGLRSWTI
ncbi:citrate lyase holo-[acyl-carrier protein] synthase [Anoxynatronum buryatiense]|uniref:citrate lyase holo-[acyl-carrier protein] synthase n=1 Tax=Anoxynatronum buryatiense TaxID=489973 RepID=A0AA46AKC4_9CLOT|nr:citrate lyase holo-[acyl-carrier protein] synthase [Anoxynatronum buryatiense]SMP68521.1 holo-ACP synthase [Anoxynatronum buryatiense]